MEGEGGGVVCHKVTTRMNEWTNELYKCVGRSVAEGKNPLLIAHFGSDSYTSLMHGMEEVKRPPYAYFCEFWLGT